MVRLTDQGKKLRATMMSTNSLLQTVFVAILAPVIGSIADNISLGAAFLAVAATLLLANRGALAERSLRTLSCYSCCCCCRGEGSGAAAVGGHMAADADYASVEMTSV